MNPREKDPATIDIPVTTAKGLTSRYNIDLDCLLLWSEIQSDLIVSNSDESISQFTYSQKQGYMTTLNFLLLYNVL